MTHFICVCFSRKVFFFYCIFWAISLLWTWLVAGRNRAGMKKPTLVRSRGCDLVCSGCVVSGGSDTQVSIFGPDNCVFSSNLLNISWVYSIQPAHPMHSTTS